MNPKQGIDACFAVHFTRSNFPRPGGGVELGAGKQLSGATKKAFSSFLLLYHVLLSQTNSETQAGEAPVEILDFRL